VVAYIPALLGLEDLEDLFVLGVLEDLFVLGVLEVQLVRLVQGVLVGLLL